MNLSIMVPFSNRAEEASGGVVPGGTVEKAKSLSQRMTWPYRSSLSIAATVPSRSQGLKRISEGYCFFSLSCSRFYCGLKDFRQAFGLQNNFCTLSMEWLIRREKSNLPLHPSR